MFRKSDFKKEHNNLLFGHAPLTTPVLLVQAKQKIDQQHLQLQNLLYEVMHLQKEITKCLEFKYAFLNDFFKIAFFLFFQEKNN